MNRLQRAAVIIELIQKLKDRGSWCGETHLQKSIFFLQSLFDIPLPFQFILYKHGPYSFDLTDEISNLRADEIVKLQPQPYPYGPSFVLGEGASLIREKFRKTIGTYEANLDFIAETLGKKGVVELEKLATALFVTLPVNKNAEDRARLVHELKPHVTLSEAMEAVSGVDSILVKKEQLSA